MQSMVQRLSSSGAVIGPDERVDATTALRAYTLDAAWIAGEEAERGSLALGKLADFVVLNQDFMSAPVEKIGDTASLLTVVGGKVVYAAEVFSGEK